MKKIEALVPAFKADEVRQALAPYKLRCLTLIEARGGGSDQTQVQEYRGAQYAQDAFQIKLELIVDDDQAETIADTIVSALKTGALCDGEVSVLPMEAVLRVRVGKQRALAPVAQPTRSPNISLKSLWMRFLTSRTPT